MPRFGGMAGLPTYDDRPDDPLDSRFRPATMRAAR